MMTEFTNRSDHIALGTLVTNEQTQLLGLINQLKNLGISKWIDLPQIIVVGAQSSGKSSVLEAISRIPFPRGDTLCTTFATEVTLIRDVANSVKVRIRPGPSASPSRKKYLQEKSFICEDFNSVDLTIKNATDYIRDVAHLEKDHSRASFLEDTLCIECTDPSFPPLTLIDLPGLTNVRQEGQNENDPQVVEKMVQTYVQNPKSIILAIVSASSDMSDPKILHMAKQIDPSGRRTLGIITKPDTLPEGSVSQQTFTRLARNENELWHLNLGWHVIRNRNYEERGSSLDDRDRVEHDWFMTSNWANTMDPGSLGVPSLRQRLAGLLEEHTRKFLPEVVAEIQNHLSRCEKDLTKLGPARETPAKQRDFLIKTSEGFKNLVYMSSEGLLRNEFFAAGAQYQNRRIRARVQVLNKAFAEVMQKRGNSLGSRTIFFQNLDLTPRRYLEAAGISTSGDTVSYLKAIGSIISNSSGKELPGEPNYDVIRQVFVMKASKWEAIATAHVDEVWTTVRDALLAMIQHCANLETSQRIMRHVLSDALAEKRSLMNTKLKDLLRPHLKCHPVTYDANLEGNVQVRRNVLTTTSTQTLSVEENVLCRVEAYYDIAIKRFIDNVAILVIEMGLLEDLADIFSPSVVSRMSDQQLKQIAGESALVEEQRKQLTKKRDQLERALRECQINSATDIDDCASNSESPTPSSSSNSNASSSSSSNASSTDNFTSQTSTSTAAPMQGTSSFSFSSDKRTNLFDNSSFSNGSKQTTNSSNDSSTGGFFGGYKSTDSTNASTKGIFASLNSNGSNATGTGGSDVKVRQVSRVF